MSATWLSEGTTLTGLPLHPGMCEAGGTGIISFSSQSVRGMSQPDELVRTATPGMAQGHSPGAERDKAGWGGSLQGPSGLMLHPLHPPQQQGRRRKPFTSPCLLHPLDGGERRGKAKVFNGITTWGCGSSSAPQHSVSVLNDS